MRRRTASTGNYDHDDKKHHPSSPTNASASSHSILSNSIVFSIVIFFLCLGFMDEHYRHSRSQDPFLSASAGIQKAHHLAVAQKQGAIARGRQSLLSAEEDEALEYDKDNDNVRYHVIFSTDCSPYQHWQSYLVYYTAMKVRQTGHVTRIASGCSADEAKEMKAWFERDVQFMSKRFHLHLTPHFSGIKNAQGEIVGDYKFFNKPFGAKYWLEHNEFLQFDAATGQFGDDVQRDIVILIDPDMALMRPLTADFTDDRQTIIAKSRQDHIIARKVGPGKPFAQVYGFAAQWEKLDLKKITGDPNTPAASVSNTDGILYYPVGPPYLATVPDMYNIASHWAKYVPGTYEQYPHLLAEMFAFCIAAAHLEMPFQLINSLMISDVQSSQAEGWPLIDKIPAENVCSVARGILNRQGGPQTTDEEYFLPNIVHLCQRYSLGEDWFFGKRAIPSDIYECTAPLFDEPPNDVAVSFDYKYPPNGKKEKLSPKEVTRNAFMICYLSQLVNEAATFYKKAIGCESSEQPSEARNLARYMREKKH